MTEQRALHLRQARMEESAAISALARRSKAYWGYDDAFMDACAGELTYSAEDIRTQPVIIAELHGKLAGFFSLFRETPARIELDALFVDPPYIGRGIGRRLFCDAQSRARESGAGILFVQSDPNALPFYQAMGGHVAGEKPSLSIPDRMLPILEYQLR